MLAYPSYGSHREYATAGNKRYDSRDIARAWASSTSSNGKCRSAMSFTDGRFYSYATCIAERIEWEGQTVFLVNEGSYSVTTSGHQSQVRGAVAGRGKVFYVPHVSTGTKKLSDVPAILSGWQHEATLKLNEAESAKREIKRSRLIGEAYGVWEKMTEFARFFQADLTDYVIKFPVPVAVVVGDEMVARIIAMRLGADPSPWLRRSPVATFDSFLPTAVAASTHAAA